MPAPWIGLKIHHSVHIYCVQLVWIQLYPVSSWTDKRTMHQDRTHAQLQHQPCLGRSLMRKWCPWLTPVRPAPRCSLNRRILRLSWFALTWTAGIRYRPLSPLGSKCDGAQMFFADRFCLSTGPLCGCPISEYQSLGIRVYQQPCDPIRFPNYLSL